TLMATISGPSQDQTPELAPISTNFTTPLTDTSVQTLILYNSARLNQLYPTGDTITATQLITRLNQLAQDSHVHGVVVDLNSEPAIAQAYATWQQRADHPLEANYVAAQIKALIYALAPS